MFLLPTGNITLFTNINLKIFIKTPCIYRHQIIINLTFPKHPPPIHPKNMYNPQSPLIFLLCVLTISTAFAEPTTIYELLRSNGLPMGLLPKGVTDFTFDDSGRFEVHLDEACNAKFEDELHYERNVSGTLSFGQIGGLSGISAQDLFLWFPVKEIRVDIPSSGLIYFDVGVVFKQFSLSSFETPRECLASSNRIIAQTVDMNPSRKLRIQKNDDKEHVTMF